MTFVRDKVRYIGEMNDSGMQAVNLELHNTYGLGFEQDTTVRTGELTTSFNY
jgi:hypothetical protein